MRNSKWHGFCMILPNTLERINKTLWCCASSVVSDNRLVSRTFFSWRTKKQKAALCGLPFCMFFLSLDFPFFQEIYLFFLGNLKFKPGHTTKPKKQRILRNGCPLQKKWRLPIVNASPSLSNFHFLASCCATEFWRTMLAAGQIGSSSIWTGEMKQYLKPPP